VSRRSESAHCRGSAEQAGFTTKKLVRSAHTSVIELAADITARAGAWNDNPKPYIWTKTADDILARLAGYCAAITGTDYADASISQDTRPRPSGIRRRHE
jgi:hypothetical protein